jgi:hypothetical protein
MRQQPKKPEQGEPDALDRFMRLFWDAAIEEVEAKLSKEKPKSKPPRESRSVRTNQ